MPPFKVRFHYLGKDQPALLQTLLPVNEIRSKLQKMDKLSRTGPWTSEYLTLIAENPRTAASQLSAKLGCETQPFKAKIRRLKKLGLTQSFEVGYALTDMGEEIIAE